MEEWRTFLYPLGFISAIAFGARFIVQWLQSERQQKSVVTPLFWKISLFGNLFLLCHCLIQFQFHICLIQGCNAVISWRNLNLTQTNLAPVSFKTVCFMLAGTILFITTLFFMQDGWSTHEGGWFRIPAAPWQKDSAVSTDASLFLWHVLGTFAYVLFSIRFWLQWWWIEKTYCEEKNFSSPPFQETRQLPLSFWWLSLTGAVLSIFYFAHIDDMVNLIGPLVGLVPYARNLMLMHNQKRALES